MRSQSIADRFWKKVERSGADECWLWAGCKIKGYGQFLRGGGQRVYAHRFAYELARGPIPEGMLVLHRCDNPPCCNERHLFLGSDLDNMRDKVAKGRQARERRNGNGRLTDGQVAELRAMRTSGATLETLGRHFGISMGYAGMIVRGEWR